jgi:hypothetical protein
MRMNLIAPTLFVGAALFVLTPAHADQVWLFNTPSGDQGTSHTYTGSGGTTITATAFAPNIPFLTNGCFSFFGCATHLYGKNGGGDENGLGLTNDPTGDHEISVTSPKSFIQFDLSNLGSSMGQLSFQAGSTTSGEGWAIYLTNVSGTLPGSSFDSCTAGGARNCEAINFYSGVLGVAGMRYLDVVATAGNILVAELDTHAVPGPIAGAGLPGLILASGGLLGWWRRRRAASA